MLSKVCAECGETKPLEEFLTWNTVDKNGRPRINREQLCKTCRVIKFRKRDDGYKASLRGANKLISKHGEIPLSDLGILAELDMRGWDVHINEPVKLPMVFFKKYFRSIKVEDMTMRATNLKDGYWTVTVYQGDKATQRNIQLSNLEFFEQLNSI